MNLVVERLYLRVEIGVSESAVLKVGTVRSVIYWTILERFMYVGIRMKMKDMKITGHFELFK